MTRKTRVLAAASLLVFVAAAGRAEIGPYIGASVGQAQIDVSFDDIDQDDFGIDDDDFAFKVFFGVELLGPLAIEASYRDFGSVSDGNNVLQASSETDGFDAFLVGRLPIGPVALFAKGGFILWDTTAEVSSPLQLGLADFRFEDDGTDPAFGVGLAVEVWKIAVRGEIEYFDLELPDEIVMFSLGVSYDF